MTVWTGDVFVPLALGVPYCTTSGTTAMSNTKHAGSASYNGGNMPPYTSIYETGVHNSLTIALLSHVLFALLGGTPTAITAAPAVGVGAGEATWSTNG